MTIHQIRRLTAGEEAVIARAEDAAVAIDDPRGAAIAALRREGLPHRRIEAWHYTDLRALVTAWSEAPATAGGPEVADADAALLPPLLPGSLVVDLGGDNDRTGAAGLVVERTNAAADWRRTVNHMDREVDTIRLLNAALGTEGTAIRLAPGAVFDQGIELRAGPGGARGQAYTLVAFGKGARATLVERFAPSGRKTFSATVTDLVLGEGAEVLYVLDQARGPADAHLSQLNVSLGRDAVFRLFVLNAGGTLVRTEVHVDVLGEGGAIEIRGVNLLASGAHVDVTTTLNHRVPNTTSTETFRNVVTGGHGVFQGMIKVAPGAQKTDARMACNTLLLSDEGDFSAKPELEIFADDVQCGHGATAGEIDANHLFYLMSRGIPEREARQLLVKAFVRAVVEELGHEDLVQALERRIDAWLDAH